MPIRCVILDFDGTFTDVEREAAPFTAAFPKLVADLVGSERVASGWEKAIAEVRANPQVFGWIFDGKVVAPGDADPYILATSAVNRIFDHAGLLRDSRLRAAVVQTLYRQAYEHTEPAYRPHAGETLQELLRRELPVFVVSNSDSATVGRKLDTLGVPVLPQGVPYRPGHVQLFGDARKFAVEEPAPVDGVFTALPVQVAIGGPRAVFVRRGAYYQVLREIAARTGVGAKDTLVCGESPPRREGPRARRRPRRIARGPARRFHRA